MTPKDFSNLQYAWATCRERVDEMLRKNEIFLPDELNEEAVKVQLLLKQIEIRVIIIDDITKPEYGSRRIAVLKNGKIVDAVGF